MKFEAKSPSSKSGASKVPIYPPILIKCAWRHLSPPPICGGGYHRGSTWRQSYNQQEKALFCGGDCYLLPFLCYVIDYIFNAILSIRGQGLYQEGHPFWFHQKVYRSPLGGESVLGARDSASTLGCCSPLPHPFNSPPNYLFCKSGPCLAPELWITGHWLVISA